jgi:predicted RNA binding protein YcfA (HicA-like mRNA interferase family)
MRVFEFITEKWTEKYKKSIDCKNPKGFSQKAHCDGRKKANEMSHHDAIKQLKKHHYHLDRQHGGHEIWKDEEGHTFALPHKHHGKDISKGVERQLKKEITHESADPILDFINEKNKTFELSYGNCGMLAIALHEKFNMDHFLIVENPLHPERAYHVAAEKNGKIYDASGIITKEDLWWKGYDEESEEDPKIVEVTADESFYRYIGRATDANIKPEDLLAENFADGKVKGKSRPGRVKKAGASCKGSVTDLRAKAKKYSGEKGKMYHWCANMKAGKK